MDTDKYIEHCELLLNDKEFYRKLEANQTLTYDEEFKQNITGMLKKKNITQQECYYLPKIWRSLEHLFLRVIKNTYKV